MSAAAAPPNRTSIGGAGTSVGGPPVVEVLGVPPVVVDVLGGPPEVLLVVVVDVLGGPPDVLVVVVVDVLGGPPEVLVVVVLVLGVPPLDELLLEPDVLELVDDEVDEPLVELDEVVDTRKPPLPVEPPKKPPPKKPGPPRKPPLLPPVVATAGATAPPA